MYRGSLALAVSHGMHLSLFSSFHPDASAAGQGLMLALPFLLADALILLPDYNALPIKQMRKSSSDSGEIAADPAQQQQQQQQRELGQGASMGLAAGGGATAGLAAGVSNNMAVLR
jgi:hypothetical protein